MMREWIKRSWAQYGRRQRTRKADIVRRRVYSQFSLSYYGGSVYVVHMGYAVHKFKGEASADEVYSTATGIMAEAADVELGRLGLL